MSPYKVFKLSRRIKKLKILSFIILFLAAIAIYFTGKFSALEITDFCAKAGAASVVQSDAGQQTEPDEAVQEVAVNMVNDTEDLKVPSDRETQVPKESQVSAPSAPAEESLQENVSDSNTGSSKTVSSGQVKSEQPDIAEETTVNKPISEDYYIPQIPLDIELQKYTCQLCREHGISYELILAVMYYESCFDTEAFAYNDNGSYDSGIMQINSCNIENLSKNYGINDLSNPYENIYAGISIIAEKIQSLGENDGLMAYNMGLGGYYTAVNNGVYQTKYSRKILEKKQEIEKMPHGI